MSDAFNLRADLPGVRVADQEIRSQQGRWHTLQEWRGGQRCLTIIDESPRLIEPDDAASEPTEVEPGVEA